MRGPLACARTAGDTMAADRAAIADFNNRRLPIGARSMIAVSVGWAKTRSAMPTRPWARFALPTLPHSSHRQAVVAQRERAVARARRVGDGVEHCRRRDADGRLADAAPDAAVRRHDDRLDFRHLREPHRVIGVEVLLHDAPVLDLDAAEEQAS